MASAFVLGGVGAAVTLDNVVEIAAGASVALDAAALDRVKKESPTPTAFKGEDEATAGAADASAATACDGAATLTEAQARAVVLARVLSVVNGSTRVRPAVLRFLADGLLNARVTPVLPATADAATLAALAAAVSRGGPTVASGDVGRALAAAGAPGPTGLSPDERVVLSSGRAAAAGVAALAAGEAARAARAATGVAALAAAALKVDAKAFDVPVDDGHAGAAAVAGEVRGLLAGTKAGGRGAGAPPALAAAPAAHGALAAALAPAAAAARAELATPAKGAGKAPPPPLELATTQAALARALLAAAGLARQRAVALGGEVGDATAAAATARAAAAAADDALADAPADAPALAAALAASAAVRALTAATAAEAAAALVVIGQAEAEAEAALAAAAAVQAPTDDGGAKKKGGKKGGGADAFALGPGVAALAAYLRADGGGDVPSLLHPAAPTLPAALDALRSAADAVAARRRPKIAKGARDFLPDQMTIRKRAFGIIERVFESHGAVAIDTPVFELRETLTGKYGEDSKLIYDLADQGGEALSLRYDLTVPFARYVALHGVGNIKRYHVGKVYRRDQPAMARGRFREFFQCDFDVAGAYPHMVADAEVIKVLTEVLDGLALGEYEVKLNHRGLLDGGLAAAGVPPSKFRAACSAIDKLDKEPWEAVRDELVAKKGVDAGVADRIHALVSLRGDPADLLAVLTAPDSPVAGQPAAAAALADLAELARLLGALRVPKGRVVLDMSLARGLDYYTGVIYEAVLQGAAVGSIAAGGRYDGLVGMFSGTDVPAVGVSIGIERVFSIVEAATRAAAAAEGGRVRDSETAVLVASVGKGLQEERMGLAADLWAAGVAAEFGYKANPNLKDQLHAADEAGIPFVALVGAEEVAAGVVKVKDMAAGTEESVPRGEVVGVLAARVAGLGERALVAGRGRGRKEEGKAKE